MDNITISVKDINLLLTELCRRDDQHHLLAAFKIRNILNLDIIGKILRVIKDDCALQWISHRLGKQEMDPCIAFPDEEESIELLQTRIKYFGYRTLVNLNKIRASVELHWRIRKVKFLRIVERTFFLSKTHRESQWGFISSFS